MVSGQDVLRKRIGQTIFDHMPGASCDAYMCRCGAVWTRDHAADAVIAALGFTERYGAAQFGEHYGYEPDVETVRREWPGGAVVRCYVTPWERIEDDQ